MAQQETVAGRKCEDGNDGFTTVFDENNKIKVICQDCHKKILEENWKTYEQG